MKKFLLLIFSIFLFISGTNIVEARGSCEINAVRQMAKILYSEVGGNYSSVNSENFFGRLATASVILNHTELSPHNTGSMYSRMLQYTDTEYAGYSSYKDKAFETVVPLTRRGEMLYISALVLSGKFTLPKEILYQAAQYILANDGAHEFTNSGSVYFGYSSYATLSNTDVFGNTVSTDPDTLRDIAKSFELTSYDQYNSSDVCNLVSNINGSSSGGGSGSSNGGASFNASSSTGGNGSGLNQQTNPRLDYSNMCSNDNILKAFRIIGYAIQLAKWLVPGLLIVFGMIDFVKALTSNDEKAINKATSAFIKRFIAGVVVFFIPTIMLVLLDFFQITNGIEKPDDPNFGSCTKCLFDPTDANCS